jgi:hypothetical protein
MDWEVIAPMIATVVLTVTVGGVLVLRPIAKRVGDLMELYVRDQTEGVESDVHHMRGLLETMNARLQLMEERQDFTERLLAGSREDGPESRGDPSQGPELAGTRSHRPTS